MGFASSTDLFFLLFPFPSHSHSSICSSLRLGGLVGLAKSFDVLGIAFSEFVFKDGGLVRYFIHTILRDIPCAQRVVSRMRIGGGAVMDEGRQGGKEGAGSLLGYTYFFCMSMSMSISISVCISIST